MRTIQIGTSLLENEQTTEIFESFKEYFRVKKKYDWWIEYIICKEPSAELVSAIEGYYAYVKEQNRKRDEYIDMIAREVVSQLSDEDKAYIYANPSSTEHHFGMGLGIRNKYIYNEDLDFDIGHPDDFSATISSRVASLIIEDYDFENPFYRHMYDDFTFTHIRRLYFALEGKYPDEILAKYADEPDAYKAAERCEKKVRKIVVNPTRFKKKAIKVGLTEQQCNEFMDYVNEYNSKHWDVIPYDIALLGGSLLAEDERKRYLELLRAVMKQTPRASIEMPAFVFNQKDAALIAASEFGRSLQRFPQFSMDDEIIRAALNDNGEAIQYVHKSLRDKKEYLELALSSEYGDTLSMRCMAKYRDDDELVKIALEANGRNIEFASKRIRDDFEMAKFAITHQKNYYPESTVCNLSRRLRDCKEIALLDIREGHACVDDYSARLRDCEEIADALLASEHKWRLYMMSDRIQRLYRKEEEE